MIQARAQVIITIILKPILKECALGQGRYRVPSLIEQPQLERPLLYRYSNNVTDHWMEGL